MVFGDETSIQKRGNVVRVLGGGKLKALRRNKKFYLVGSIALNGSSYALKADKANKDTFSKLLIGLRETNPTKPILLIIDNASFHWAADVRWLARQLGIRIVYLPPHSPDLNPTEYPWKDLKKQLAFKSIEVKEEKGYRNILQLVETRKYSYARAWLENSAEQLVI